jgi:hypothetical protein
MRKHRSGIRISNRTTLKAKLGQVAVGSSLAALFAATVMYIYMTKAHESKAAHTRLIENQVGNMTGN